MPNFYLYAANNPSEGTIARRRSAATLISHLTPPIQHAGLYRGLLDLKSSIDRWRALPPQHEDRTRIAQTIRSQAVAVDLVDEPKRSGAKAGETGNPGSRRCAVLELETTLIPHGLHVLGKPIGPDQRNDLLMSATNTAMGEDAVDPQILCRTSACRRR